MCKGHLIIIYAQETYYLHIRVQPTVSITAAQHVCAPVSSPSAPHVVKYQNCQVSPIKVNRSRDRQRTQMHTQVNRHPIKQQLHQTAV